LGITGVIEFGVFFLNPPLAPTDYIAQISNSYQKDTPLNGLSDERSFKFID